MMSLKCESCGAPLSINDGVHISICDYCGAQNTIRDNFFNSEKEEPKKIEDVIVDTIPCIGSTIFQKKLFVVHRTYAEVLDKKTNALELHIDFNDVMQYGKTFLADGMIWFKMKNNQKHTVNFYTKGKYDLAMKALNGLIWMQSVKCYSSYLQYHKCWDCDFH